VALAALDLLADRYATAVMFALERRKGVLQLAKSRALTKKALGSDAARTASNARPSRKRATLR
jgi:hypothetical protein